MDGRDPIINGRRDFGATLQHDVAKLDGSCTKCGMNREEVNKNGCPGKKSYTKPTMTVHVQHPWIKPTITVHTQQQTDLDVLMECVRGKWPDAYATFIQSERKYRLLAHRGIGAWNYAKLSEGPTEFYAALAAAERVLWEEGYSFKTDGVAWWWNSRDAQGVYGLPNFPTKSDVIISAARDSISRLQKGARIEVTNGVSAEVETAPADVERGSGEDILQAGACPKCDAEDPGQLYPMLDPLFLKLMNDIGAYGDEKYKDDGFRLRNARGEVRWMPRVMTEEIGIHMAAHYYMYSRGELHDHFGTLDHQLAAAAYNCMMEFCQLMTERRLGVR